MILIKKLKKKLYFIVANYFKFFAQIQIKIWHPKVIVITGSNGKTTMLNMLESQIKNQAYYSHHANSSFGIPFNILNIDRKSLTIGEWPMLFLRAPIQAFKKLHQERIYIVEADCDRPNEGKFLGQLLKPDITIWLSVSKTHSINFSQPVERNIAKEFGNFLKCTQNLCIINADSELIVDQLTKIKPEIIKISKKNHLQNYSVFKDGTTFKIDGNVYKFKYLLPKDSFYLLSATIELLKKLNIPFDNKFNDFVLPPGRSTIFKGIKNITIIDSSYNSTPASFKAILEMFNSLPGKKFAVLGDMIELGSEEQIEHERLALLIYASNLSSVILIGPRVSKYTYPKLRTLANYPIITFQTPKEGLDYLKNNLSGNEVLLFKGARFLEGIIEHLLLNKEDIKKLCRREKAWQERRKYWGI